MIAWPMVILGAILANVAPWVGFSMIIFELTINNFMHTIIFQPKKPVYNPGLITNSLLLLPLGTVVFLKSLDFFQWYDWALSVAAGILIVGLLAYKTTSRVARTAKEAGNPTK
ncbi:MAG: HXXEE domain-containing protein [Bacteroidetes bacterium]|nr:HXXEE domain-containing protein [Bacteroidota bacterium]